MKLKPLVVIATVLVLAASAAYYARRPAPSSTSDPRIGKPLLDPAAAAEATRFELRHDGKTVDLRQSPDGNWKVVSYHDLPVDFSKFSRMVSELTAAKLQRVVTTNPARLARLEFGETSLAFHKGETKTAQIDIGRTNESGGRFVRLGGEEKAYLANLNSWFDAEPKNWADAVIVRQPANEVSRIEVTLPDGSSVAAKRAKADAPWEGEGPLAGKLKTSAVDSLLGDFASLRFTDTRAKDDEGVAKAKAHTRTVKLDTFGGKSVTVTLARTPEEKKPKPPATPPAEPKSAPAPNAGPTPAPDAKTAEPEFETIPAGPVFVEVKSSDSNAAINQLMTARAFEMSSYTFEKLPTKATDWEEAKEPAEGTNPR